MLSDVDGVTLVQGMPVTVISYDGSTPRLVDCGAWSSIVKVNRKRVVIIDSDGELRPCNPKCLKVRKIS